VNPSIQVATMALHGADDGLSRYNGGFHFR